jgi:hypothetical protein
VIRRPRSSGQVQQGVVETDIQKLVGTDALTCFGDGIAPSSEILRYRLRHAHLQLRQLDLGSEVLVGSYKTVVERGTLGRSTEQTYRVGEQGAFLVNADVLISSKGLGQTLLL